MDFEEYLLSKKIDSGAFKKADPEQWQSWKFIFDQVHPASFTAQKLFLINSFRHLYPVKEAEVEKVQTAKPKKPGKLKPAAEQSTAEEQGPEVKVKIEVQPKPKIPAKAKPIIPGKAKPKIPVKSKPVIPGSKSDSQKAEEEGKPIQKPRPVIKHKPVSEESISEEKQPNDVTAKPRPKIPVKAKPKIPLRPKPVIPASKPEISQKKEEEGKKKPRPVIKPKIKRPKND